MLQTLLFRAPSNSTLLASLHDLHITQNLASHRPYFAAWWLLRWQKVRQAPRRMAFWSLTTPTPGHLSTFPFVTQISVARCCFNKRYLALMWHGGVQQMYLRAVLCTLYSISLISKRLGVTFGHAVLERLRLLSPSLEPRKRLISRSATKKLESILGKLLFCYIQLQPGFTAQRGKLR